MRHTDRTFVIAAAGCAAAAVLFAATLVRALTVDPTPPVPADPLLPAVEHTAPVAPSDEAGAIRTAQPGEAPRSPELEVPPPSAQPLTMEAVQLAVENDPFREDRQRPPERYRMPGDVIERGAPPPPPPPPFQVLGIAQSPGGGLAVMQIEDSPPRVLSVGESLFGYTLERVEGEVATLSGQGRILTLTVAQASPTPVMLEEEDGRGRRSRGRNAEEVLERLRGRRNGENETYEQVREMQQNAVEMIRRMMEQQQRQRGNNRGGNNDASGGVFWTPLTMDGDRTPPIPTQRGRIVIRRDTSIDVLPPYPIRR